MDITTKMQDILIPVYMHMLKTSLEKSPFASELLVHRLHVCVENNVGKLGETNLTILPQHQVIMIRH